MKKVNINSIAQALCAIVYTITYSILTDRSIYAMQRVIENKMTYDTCFNATSTNVIGSASRTMSMFLTLKAIVTNLN